MAKENQNKPAEPIAKLQYKGFAEYRHDLFLLEDTVKFKQNNSYKQYQPIIEERLHGHVFHSVNERNGRANTMCSPCGGHTHEVTIEWDESGENVLSAVCGPPIRKTTKWIPGEGEVTRFERIVYKRAEGSSLGDVHDDHIHKLIYKHSEMVSQAKQKNIQQHSQSEISRIMDKSKPATQAIAQKKLEDSAAQVAE